jgi:hypothetical protein
MKKGLEFSRPFFLTKKRKPTETDYKGNDFLETMIKYFVKTINSR